MNCKWNDNPCLLAGLLLELSYLCSDCLALAERLLGNFGSLLSGGWLGLSMVLMLIGLPACLPRDANASPDYIFETKIEG